MGQWSGQSDRFADLLGGLDVAVGVKGETSKNVGDKIS